MAKGLKIANLVADQYYLKWQQAKVEIKRLRNYYEVDFDRAFERIRELKEEANYLWDQYEKTRSIEPSQMNPEALAIYELWCKLGELMKEIQVRYEQTDDFHSRRRLKDTLQRLQVRADDLWRDLEQTY